MYGFYGLQLVKAHPNFYIEALSMNEHQTLLIHAFCTEALLMNFRPYSYMHTFSLLRDALDERMGASEHPSPPNGSQQRMRIVNFNSSRPHPQRIQ